MIRSLIAHFTFVLALTAQGFPTTCSDGSLPHFPSKANTSIDSCGINGSFAPAAPDGLQNAAKNNFCGLGAGVPIDSAAMVALQGKVDSDSTIPHGTPPAKRTALTKLGEGKVVVYEGFVFLARQECGESVNCGAKQPNVNASHDIHISLLGTPRQTKQTSPQAARDKEECTSVVAEMAPHHRPAEWNECNLLDVAAKGLRVRVTGQQFFDGSHLACLNGMPRPSQPKRASLWEIHPIYKFEVCPAGDCKAGGWKPLEDFAKGKTVCAEKKCD